MQIAYLNKGKAVKESETEKVLKNFQDRDIRLFVNKHLAEIKALGITEPEFIAQLRTKLNCV